MIDNKYLKHANKYFYQQLYQISQTIVKKKVKRKKKNIYLKHANHLSWFR